jgi:predicted metal-dependent enzyme (double-stranded beta helix superfamily)
MFDPDRFVADCRVALAEDRDRQRALQEVVARAVGNPADVLRAFGEPHSAAVHPLHVNADLTILHVAWPPGIAFRPHDHRMWAVIGVYAGAEDNVFWRRLPPSGGRTRGIEAVGAQALRTGDVAVLGADVVHSVVNPIPRFSCSLQIYGGDFFAIERSEWDAETLQQRQYDVASARREFEEANAALAGAGLPRKS